ncbi:unnamed protein product [Rotaria sordida]|uniref:Uncharacterized protein n=1 Tax=Rotaria sordida TaxID=392033 RepID=A0A819BBR7_9BILA|nr:unnamed protein product [Rotaria sordida]CAF3794183.1 unnamed protein product [Rotaria sordida]
MGAKLGKSKSLLISEKINEQDKSMITNSNNHTNGTIITLEKKFKKNTEKSSNKKSSNTKVDKYTSTDGGIISPLPSSSIKQLVDGSRCNNLLSDVHTVETNSIYQSETSSKDVLEFRNACIRRGIISPETNNFILLTSKEQNYQVNTVNESTDETTTRAVGTNNAQVQNE